MDDRVKAVAAWLGMEPSEAEPPADDRTPAQLLDAWAKLAVSTERRWAKLATDFPDAARRLARLRADLDAMGDTMEAYERATAGMSEPEREAEDERFLAAVGAMLEKLR
jgi:hypothetical protein